MNSLIQPTTGGTLESQPEATPDYQQERLVTINAPDTPLKTCLECNRQYTGHIASCPEDGGLLVKVQTDPLIGSVLDGCYEVLSVLGHGGMGVVYKARHKLMDKIVAIKMLKSQLVSDAMSVKRFQQEVKASARIDHPHAITVYNFGISPDGVPYIVMDCLEGISLADVIKNEDHVEVDRAVKIISQACEALAHAHKQGVVHRDLKPSNIVLTNYDDDPNFVKVVDFGVAKLMGPTSEAAQRLTQTGEVCGSPVYMSPEQCMGQELDMRSDIYSMGIVLYETLSGRLPLVGKSMVDTMSKHVSELPPTFKTARPDLYIPERLEQVCFKALAKDVADRHQTMDQLREDLELAIPKPTRGGMALRNSDLFAVPPEKTVSAGISKNSFILMAVVSFALLAGGVALFAVVKNGSWPSKQPPVAMQTPGGGVTQPNIKSGKEEIRPAPTSQPAATPQTASATPTAPMAPANSPPATAEPKNAFTPQHTVVSEVKPPRAPEHKAAGRKPEAPLAKAPAHPKIARHAPGASGSTAPSHGVQASPFAKMFSELKSKQNF